MIRISLGRVGSGKTLMEVREMMKPENRRIKTYTNIQVHGLENVVTLTPDMIMTPEVIGHKKDGTEKRKYHVNLEFWKQQPRPLNIVLDEAHAILDSRKSMSSINQCMNNFLSVIRRVIGGGNTRAGTIVYITQLPNRLDVVARMMANKVTYHICSWLAVCPKCGYQAWDSSEATDPISVCPRCNMDMTTKGHFIDTYHFRSMDDYWTWSITQDRVYSKVERTLNVNQYFAAYDTLQWDNLIVKV